MIALSWLLLCAPPGLELTVDGLSPAESEPVRAAIEAGFSRAPVGSELRARVIAGAMRALVELEATLPGAPGVERREVHLNLPLSPPLVVLENALDELWASASPRPTRPEQIVPPADESPEVVAVAASPPPSGSIVPALISTLVGVSALGASMALTVHANGLATELGSSFVVGEEYVRLDDQRALSSALAIGLAAAGGAALIGAIITVAASE